MCRLSRNSGASTSWNRKGPPRPVVGKLYLYLYNVRLTGVYVDDQEQLLIGLRTANRTQSDLTEDQNNSKKFPLRRTRRNLSIPNTIDILLCVFVLH
jgi:hypothetical protein